jgi:hypothetical protein
MPLGKQIGPQNVKYWIIGGVCLALTVIAILVILLETSSLCDNERLEFCLNLR